jgi:hypothetical protein
MVGMEMQPSQFTLRTVFKWVTAVGIILGLLVAIDRWGNAKVMEIEQEAARQRVLERGSDTEYDRLLLGDEVDSLKSEFERREATRTISK